MNNPTLENKVFLALLLLVSIAFCWVLFPFYGAVFWAVILAILFAPLQRRLARQFRGKPNLAALLTWLATLLIAVLPMATITALLVHEGALLYQRIESGELDIGAYLLQVRDMLPESVQAQ